MSDGLQESEKVNRTLFVVQKHNNNDEDLVTTPCGCFLVADFDLHRVVDHRSEKLLVGYKSMESPSIASTKLLTRL